ncbi:hypothetical protein [Planctomycetes bacterium TBK1r]|uniref:Uncharacterized protein n=1 Tax=Stieleria magnilauensis TaxID=2527963 RepID=A0ABX5XVZ3_9BACT|nr:hypothetical protein TBK1r_52210 [Planctomycetes bacterium TBK1r]
MKLENSVTVVEKQSAEPTWSEDPWDRVKTAIIQRRPHLESRDMKTLPRNVKASSQGNDLSERK